MPLYNRLKEFRVRLGVNQQQMGALVGTSRQTISQIERGLKMPSMNLFIKIITALDISSDYILRDEVPSGKDYVYSEFTQKLDTLTSKQRRAAMEILDAYIRTL